MKFTATFLASLVTSTVAEIHAPGCCKTHGCILHFIENYAGDEETHIRVCKDEARESRPLVFDSAIPIDKKSFKLICPTDDNDNPECTFATDSSNEPFFVGAPTSAEFEGINFEGASGNDYGGAIEIQKGGVAKFSYCGFYNNQADIFGGAISAYNAERLDVEYCTFDSNKSINQGGAILVTKIDIGSSEFDWEGTTSLSIVGSTFTGNTQLNGGAVYGGGGDLVTIEHSTFTGNLDEDGNANNIVFSKLLDSWNIESTTIDDVVTTASGGGSDVAY